MESLAKCLSTALMIRLHFLMMMRLCWLMWKRLTLVSMFLLCERAHDFITLQKHFQSKTLILYPNTIPSLIEIQRL